MVVEHLAPGGLWVVERGRHMCEVEGRRGLQVCPGRNGVVRYCQCSPKVGVFISQALGKGGPPTKRLPLTIRFRASFWCRVGGVAALTETEQIPPPGGGGRGGAEAPDRCS